MISALFSYPKVARCLQLEKIKLRHLIVITTIVATILSICFIVSILYPLSPLLIFINIATFILLLLGLSLIIIKIGLSSNKNCFYKKEVKNTPAANLHNLMIRDWHIDYAPKEDEDNDIPRLCLENQHGVKIHFCRNPISTSMFIFEEKEKAILFSPTGYDLNSKLFEEAGIIQKTVTKESWTSGLPPKGYLKLGEVSVGDWKTDKTQESNFHFLGHVHFPTIKNCSFKIEQVPKITKEVYENCFREALKLGCTHIQIPWNPIERNFKLQETLRTWRAATAIGILEAAATVFSIVPEHRRPYIEICNNKRIPIWDDDLCFPKNLQNIFQKFIQESKKWNEKNLEPEDISSNMQGLTSSPGKIFTIKTLEKKHRLIFISSLKNHAKDLSNTLFFIERRKNPSPSLFKSIFKTPLLKKLNFTTTPQGSCLYATIETHNNTDLKPGSSQSLLSLTNLYITCLKEAQLKGFHTIVIPFLRFEDKAVDSEKKIIEWEATVKTSLLMAGEYWFKKNVSKPQINIIVRVNH